MKSDVVLIEKYEADPGKVFDWKEPRFIEDAEGNQIQDHLYSKTIFLSSKYDNIENYIEVDEVV